MTVNLPLDMILGKKPNDVGKILRARGIDPDLPYRATLSFSSVTIEQEKPGRRPGDRISPLN